MSQQRRVRPAVGVAAVGLGLGVGGLALDRATAQQPRPATVTAASPAKLLAEGRELVRQNRLAEALTRADAVAKLGDAAGADALRREAVEDGKQQIEELTAQAKVLAGRGDAVRSKASLDLARQIASEIGLATAPPAAKPVERVVATSPPPQLPSVVQAQAHGLVVFRPADPPADSIPSVTPVAPPPILPTLPTIPPAQTAPAEKPLLPPVPNFSLTPSEPPPPAVPVPGVLPAPGATPVTLPKLATVAAGAALALPAPAQDAAPKPGPGTAEVARLLPMAPVTVGVKTMADAPAATLGTLQADLADLKEFKKQVQDLLQGKADGTATGLDAGVLRRLTDLERKIEGFEKSLDTLKTSFARLETASSSQKPAAPAVKSFVRLVNDYPTELSLILNNVSHRLKAGETKQVEVPAGSFTYELIAEGAKPITRAIRDDETVTLRIK